MDLAGYYPHCSVLVLVGLVERRILGGGLVLALGLGSHQPLGVFFVGDHLAEDSPALDPEDQGTCRC